MYSNTTQLHVEYVYLPAFDITRIEGLLIRAVPEVSKNKSLLIVELHKETSAHFRCSQVRLPMIVSYIQIIKGR